MRIVKMYAQIIALDLVEARCQGTFFLCVESPATVWTIEAAFTNIFVRRAMAIITGIGSRHMTVIDYGWMRIAFAIVFIFISRCLIF